MTNKFFPEEQITENVIGFGIAIFAITILENERQKRKADKS